MSFKNKLFSKIPSCYIKHKVNDKDEAKVIIDGYKAIRKNNLFDDEFYLNKYPKVKVSGMDPLLHYIFFGFDEGKKPNGDFDGVFYKSFYDDVDINPLIHYALFGEGRKVRVEHMDLSNFNNKDRKNILFVLHEKIGTVGGTGFNNLDIIDNLNSDFNAFILTSDGEDVELWNDGKKIANYDVSHNTNYSIIDNHDNRIDSINFEKSLYDEQLASVYEEILSKLNISIIHINHLINHSFDLINLANEMSIPYLITIHDFYYICPSIHLVDRNCQFCEFKCNQCSGIAIDKGNEVENILNIWQKYTKKILNESYLNIAPTKFTIDLYKSHLGDFTNFKLIEHGMDLNLANNLYSRSDCKIRILVAGHISPHKGSLLIKEIKKLDKDDRLEFHFIGTTIPNLNKYGINHGRYKRKDFNRLVAEIKPTYSLILSICPETYSYTLTESWASGIPVIASKLGALEERIKKTNAGWLVDYKNPRAIYNDILTISHEDYLNKIENISKIKFKSLKEMTDEYNEIYEGLNV